jgi:hypothetical protein
MDKQLGDLIRAARERKVKDVTGGDSRFTWSRDRATKIAGTGWYSQPADYRPSDSIQKVQNVADAPAAGKPDYGRYDNDSGKGDLSSRFNDAKLVKPDALGSDDGMSKPGFDGRRAGAGYVGVGNRAAHSPGRLHRAEVPRNPSGAGPGARQGGTPETSGQSPPGARPITSRRVRGRQP